jgi:cell division protein ZapA
LKQLDVQIMGQSYLLGCPEGGEQRLLEAVEKVDSAMCKIRDAGKVKARDRIAVLASLNLAFQMAELETRAGTFAHSVPAHVESPARALNTSNATSAANGSSTDSDPRLATLIARLDGALGDDGRLL